MTRRFGSREVPAFAADDERGPEGFLARVRAIPPRRMLKLVALPVLAALPVVLAARLVIALDAQPPSSEASLLKTAIAGARRARANEFAASDFKRAEILADQALREYSRTIGETTGFLRYDLVRRHLNTAQEKVTWAWSRARQRGEASRDLAQRLIDEGRIGVAAASAAIKNSPVAPAVRANLARARVSILTAASRLKSGDYDTAAKDATFAKETADQIQGRVTSFLETYSTGAKAEMWGKWIRRTIDLSRASGEYAIVVDKLNHKCYLYRGGRLEQVYAADLGGTIHDKLRSGDRATPEGMYRVIQKRDRGQTIYYKALLINYPNEEDHAAFARAKKNGWISRYSRIGGLIEIHGEGGRREDWTLGCVALANRDMDHLFRRVSVGTPVTIVGTLPRT